MTIGSGGDNNPATSTSNNDPTNAPEVETSGAGVGGGEEQPQVGTYKGGPIPKMEPRDQLVYTAKLCEQAERYDEMAECMREVAQMNKELSVEERNLLSVAYKNAVGARRASWRIVSSVELKQRNKGNDKQMIIANAYRQRIEEELLKICTEILKLLDEYLIETATNAESKVFYFKMKGDYHRYISEFRNNLVTRSGSPKDSARQAYEEATKIATEQLPPTHPIRLGLALNFSVFFYEIIGHPQEACCMARQAFDDAIAELDNVSEESYRDSTLIMQLLRDNLTLWTTDAAINVHAAERSQAANNMGPGGGAGSGIAGQGQPEHGGATRDAGGAAAGGAAVEGGNDAGQAGGDS